MLKIVMLVDVVVIIVIVDEDSGDDDGDGGVHGAAGDYDDKDASGEVE